MYLLMLKWLLGQLAPMIQIVVEARLTQTQMPSYLDYLRFQTDNSTIGTLIFTV